MPWASLKSLTKWVCTHCVSAAGKSFFFLLIHSLVWISNGGKIVYLLIIWQTFCWGQAPSETTHKELQLKESSQWIFSFWLNFCYHLLVQVSKTRELGDAGTSRALVRHPGKDFMKVLIGYPATFLARQDKHIYIYVCNFSLLYSYLAKNSMNLCSLFVFAYRHNLNCHQNSGGTSAKSL